MAHAPLVSVVIPTYNSEKYICQAVDSVYIQKVPLELIVIDNGSEDGTIARLTPYLERDDFHLITSPDNIGPAEARNRGTACARGEYVAFLDSDDWWEKRKLSHQVYVMRKSGAVLCTTGRQLRNRDGSDTGHYIPVDRRISYRTLLRHNQINCSSVLVKRSALLEFPMEHDNDSHEDYITWLRILQKYGDAAGINLPYLQYRVYQGSKSGDKLKSAVMTYKAYRYAGVSTPESLIHFSTYAVNGVRKYH